MKIISWNVNGIRSIIKKDFADSLKAMAPDVLCLQETKATVEETRTIAALFPEYKSYINASKARKGYSGTAILSKKEPISVIYDMGTEEHDQEGRVVTVEYEDFFLVNVYTPNSGEGLKRLDYRQTWDECFLKHLKTLEEKKPVVACGDFNVAHNEIDIARPKANYNKTSGYTQQEIDGFSNLLAGGFVDTFRHLRPEEVKYSYWSYRFGARERNVGWRIDYFVVSEAFLDKVKDVAIHNEFTGSDHCPVEVQLAV